MTKNNNCGCHYCSMKCFFASIGNKSKHKEQRRRILFWPMRRLEQQARAAGRRPRQAANTAAARPQQAESKAGEERRTDRRTTPSFVFVTYIHLTSVLTRFHPASPPPRHAARGSLWRLVAASRVPARTLANPIARRPNISESHSETPEH